MRVLLVDDEPLALERLRVAFQDMPDAEVVGSAQDGDEALARIAELSPDLVILDIQMPGRNGLRVASALQAEPRPEIVFVTAFEHYAPDAFDVEAADYLLKPVRFDRLRQAVERARRRRSLREQAGRAGELERRLSEVRSAPAAERHDDFWVQGRAGLVRVPVAEVEWIEAAKDYVLLHTATRSHMIRTTMAALEEKLDPKTLMRVHRSAFVRPDVVQEVQRPRRGVVCLVLRDGVTLQVGPNYLATVEAALGI
jgi:two-component system, LytTR family, response regulator